jgi:type IV pilus assembly protein PilE
MARTRNRGFTLIELMIVLVVIAVLAAIALPSYRSYVIKANRAQAQQLAQDVANREEQFRLDARSYTTTLGSGGLNMTMQSDLATNYSIGIDTGKTLANTTDCTTAATTDTAYVVTMTAIGNQASDGPVCIDSFGNKSPAAKWQR